MAESADTHDKDALSEVSAESLDTPKPAETPKPESQTNENKNIANMENATPANTAATMSSAEPFLGAALAADSNNNDYSSHNTSDSNEHHQNQQPSLEAELDEMRNTLNDVGKNLTSFWGSVRSQGAKAIQTSRKGLETYAENARLKEYMGKARTELDRLSEQAKVSLAAAQQQQEQRQKEIQQEQASTSSSSSTTTTTKDVNPPSSFYGEVYTSPDSNPHTSSNNEEISAQEREKFHFPDASAFFSRFQTQLNSIPANWKDNLNQLQTQLNRFEGRAEDYYHKSEVYLKGAGDLLRDAVRVVPPEADESKSSSSSTNHNINNTNNASKLKSSSNSRSGASSPLSSKLPTSRRDVLLRRLRVDAADVLLIDPAKQPVLSHDAEQAEQETRARNETRAAFDAFKDNVANEGGIAGDVWLERIKNEESSSSSSSTSSTTTTTTSTSATVTNTTTTADENSDGGVSDLISAKNKLVPNTLSSDDFWLRYFFRKNQIDQEEERRKQLLQEASRQTANADDEDEEFNWDMGDDDDEEKEGEEAKKEKGKHVDQDKNNNNSNKEKGSTTKTMATPTADDSKFTSPRISSEGSSYDMMSTSAGQSEGGHGQSSNNSKDHQHDDEARKADTKESEEEDSDWE